MRYIRNYDRFRLLKESVQGKRLILLSGPSASGKTTFAANKGVTSWLDDKSVSASKIFVGTDSIMDREALPMISKILEKAGFPALSKVMLSFPDQFFNFERYYEDKFKEWQDTADEEEKKKYEGLKAAAGYDIERKGKCPRCIGPVKGQEDGRVAGMAWVAYLHPAKTIVFDDVDTAIKENFFPECEEWQLYTPLDWLLKNIASRNNEEDTSMHIDINKKGTAVDQYCMWYEASKSPALDNKSYTTGSATELLLAAGHKNPESILAKLGATGMDEFYIKRRNINTPKIVINTRDESTGEAVSADSVSL